MKKRWNHRYQKVRQLFGATTFESGLFEVFAEMRNIETLEDRSTWFEHLLKWLAKDSAQRGRYTRFKFLFQQLNKDPERQQIFIAQLKLIFNEHSLLRFFLQTGFSDEAGLLQETGRRILLRVIPSVREFDILEVAQEVINTEPELNWFLGIPEEVLQNISQLLGPESSSDFREQLTNAASEAMLVFATHLCNLGLTTQIRMRANEPLPSASPFLNLQMKLQSLVISKKPDALLDNSVTSWMSSCEKAVQAVYEDMEKNGTSIGLVYRLEVMTAVIARIRQLLAVLKPMGEPLELQKIHHLLAETVEASYQSHSIVGHVHQQTHLLSRKIAERNGESGDHYIARGKSQRRQLFFSAMKGGLIVVAMTIAKLTLHAWHLPALMDATLIWFVYTAGFLAMQFTGSTLATKLPSFTASKLARLMTTVKNGDGVETMFNEVKTVFVSQALALVGNIAAVVPFAILLELTLNYTLGIHVLDLHTSQSTLEGLHPLTSFAIFFGIVTGILLWISSIAGGWFENWIVFRKIPQAIEHHRRFSKIFGKSVAAKTARWLEHHASGISANVTLGFLFGFIPFLGTVTGLPLDSRHVTISSASAVLSVLTLDPSDEVTRAMLWACGGLVFIGLANLIVSFALALFVAARASSVNPRRFRFLLRVLGRRLLGRKQGRTD